MRVFALIFVVLFCYGQSISQEFVVPNELINEICNDGFSLNATLDISSKFEIKLIDCDDIIYTCLSTSNGGTSDDNVCNSGYNGNQIISFIESGLNDTISEVSLFITVHGDDTATLSITIRTNFGFNDNINIILIAEEISVSDLRGMIRNLRTDFEQLKGEFIQTSALSPILFYEKITTDVNRAVGWKRIKMNTMIGTDSSISLDNINGGITLNPGKYTIEAEISLFRTHHNLIRIVNSLNNWTPYKNLYGTPCYSEPTGGDTTFCRVNKQTINVDSTVTLYFAQWSDRASTNGAHFNNHFLHDEPSYVASMTVQKMP